MDPALGGSGSGPDGIPDRRAAHRTRATSARPGTAAPSHRPSRPSCSTRGRTSPATPPTRGPCSHGAAPGGGARCRLPRRSPRRRARRTGRRSGSARPACRRSPTASRTSGPRSRRRPVGSAGRPRSSRPPIPTVCTSTAKASMPGRVSPTPTSSTPARSTSRASCAPARPTRWACCTGGTAAARAARRRHRASWPSSHCGTPTGVMSSSGPTARGASSRPSGSPHRNGTPTTGTSWSGSTDAPIPRGGRPPVSTTAPGRTPRSSGPSAPTLSRALFAQRTRIAEVVVSPVSVHRVVRRRRRRGLRRGLRSEAAGGVRPTAIPAAP